jgi:mono/diheme cytochrome c family protein
VKLRTNLISLRCAVIAMLLLLRQPVSAQNSGKSNATYAELAKAPEKARAKKNPLENDPEAAVAGRILFEQHCAECHGETAEGGKKAPSLRAPEVQNAEPGAIFWLLTNGVSRRGMPVWSKLPEAQRWQIVKFLKSLGTPPANDSAAGPNSF